MNLENFTWGRVVRLHVVGEYEIVEYIAEHVEETKDRTQFHVYVDGRDTNTSAASLDEALAIAISYKYEGPNGRAARYFMRMLRD